MRKSQYHFIINYRYSFLNESAPFHQMPFVVTAIQQALAQATPDICNSDQGSHFTSPQYAQLLLAANEQISMDGKGLVLDNIFTERLWRTIKYEEVYVRTVQPKLIER